MAPLCTTIVLFLFFQLDIAAATPSFPAPVFQLAPARASAYDRTPTLAADSSANTYFPNWCGFALPAPQGDKISTVSGTFTIPALTFPDSMALNASASYGFIQWVGIDGYEPDGNVWLSAGVISEVRISSPVWSRIEIWEGKW
jgi:hypothetical protein